MKKFVVLLMALLLCVGVAFAADPVATPAPAQDVCPHEAAGAAKSHKDATCTTEGYDVYECALEGCGKEFTVIIPAFGHTPAQDATPLAESVPATCIEDGVNVWADCVVCECGKWEEKIPASEKNHKFDPEKDVEHKAECLVDAYVEKYCVYCEKILTFVDEGSALGHNWAMVDYTGDNELLPTCTEQGIKGWWQVCRNEGCGILRSLEDDGTGREDLGKYIPVLEHNFDFFVLDEDDKCVAGKWTEEFLASNGNIYDAELDAWEVNDGYDVFEGTAYPLPRVWYQYVLPTCTETGLVRVWCEECGASAEMTIAALGHDHQLVEWWGDNGVWGEDYEASSCIVPGQALYVCQRGCGDQYAAATAPRGYHVFDGEKTYFQTLPNGEVYEGTDFSKIKLCYTYTVHTDCGAEFCSVYEEKVVAGKDLVAHTKNANTVVEKAANCTEDGYVYFQCDVCKGYFVEEPKATGHSFENVTLDPMDGVITKAPTCEEDGVRTYECTNPGCDATFEEAIPALGHTVIIVKHEDATCTKDGTHIEKCNTCDVVLVDETTPAHHFYTLGSDLVFGYTAPTCTTDGAVSYFCEKCHEEQRLEKIAKLGHTYERPGYDGEDHVYTEPTCTEAGYYTYECPDCEACTFTEAGEDALGHLVPDVKTDTNYVVTLWPTCSTTGTAVYNCDRGCGGFGVETIEMLDHNWVVSWDEELKTYVRTCTKDVATTGTDLIGCGKVEKLTVKKPDYTATIKDGVVTIKHVAGTIEVENPMLYVLWSYTLEDGSSFSFRKVFSQDEANKFDIGVMDVPGAELDYVAVVVVNTKSVQSLGLTAANAQGYGFARFPG